MVFPRIAYGDLFKAAIEVNTYGTVQASAILSPCKRYRYRLTRRWNEQLPVVLFIGLNPSTADHTVQDNTARKCMDFARTWGYGGMMLANIYAFRATDPKELRRMTMQEALGPYADQAIIDAVAATAKVVCAWSDHGKHNQRGLAVAKLLAGIGCELCMFSLTQSGQPVHPLYQKGDARPIVWKPTIPNQPSTLVHLPSAPSSDRKAQA